MIADREYVNERNKKFERPLLVAVKHNHFEAAQHLIGKLYKLNN